MAATDKMERASFGGIHFPFDKRVLIGSGRQHIHIFPHSNGGEPEKMGTDLYGVDFVCQFHDCPDDPIATLYPDLYPNGLAKLRELWEGQVTKPLVVPGYGTIQAFCTNWTQTLDTRIASGEEVVLKFLQDQDPADVTKAKAGLNGRALRAAADLMLAPAPDMPAEVSIFQQINDRINDVLAYEARADITANLLAAKLEGIVQLCSHAEQSVRGLNDPLNFGVLRAMQDVWLTAQDWAADVTASATPIGVWTTTKKMSINQVSAALYNGDGTHVDELIALNPLPDYAEIRAGTHIRFYQLQA